ncbi:MAG: ComEC/Rec2 family competence protein [candidate division WOR-3 bacterium]
MSVKEFLKKRPALLPFFTFVLGLSVGAFLDLRIFLIGICFFSIFYFIKKIDIFLFILLFFAGGLYQQIGFQHIGERINFKGIYFGDRIIDLVLGELYLRTPNKEGFFIKGKGIIEFKNGYSKLKDINIETSYPTIFNKIFSLRDYFDYKIQKYCPGDVGKICSALSLGKRDNLPYSIQKRFRTCGAAHLLAVSGLHIGITFTVVFIFLRAFQLKRNISLLLSQLFIFFYALLSGFRTPVIRASIMSFFWTIGEIRNKNIDLLNILCVTGLFMLLLIPKSLFTISFQLSFLAIFSIFIMFNLLKEQLEKIPNNWFKHWILLPFFITLSAQVGTIPLIAFYFGYVPLLSLLANLILIPLTGILISGCFMLLLLPFLSEITGNFLWLVGFIFNKIMIGIENSPFAILTLPEKDYRCFLLYIVYLILIFTFSRKYGKSKE